MFVIFGYFECLNACIWALFWRSLGNEIQNGFYVKTDVGPLVLWLPGRNKNVNWLLYVQLICWKTNLREIHFMCKSKKYTYNTLNQVNNKYIKSTLFQLNLYHIAFNTRAKTLYVWVWERIICFLLNEDKFVQMTRTFLSL